MSDKGGVLGQASAVTTGTTIVYTVPGGKWAKVRVMYRFVAGTNTTFAILVNGITVMTTAALTSGQAQASTKTEMHVANPTLDGNGTDSVVAPAPYDFYLAEGDNVQYTLGTANVTDMNFQVVGVELDA